MSPVSFVCAAHAHLVVSRHGPAPLQKHVLHTANGCPGCLCVPEQRSGARGCPGRGAARYLRFPICKQLRWRVWPQASLPQPYPQILGKSQPTRLRSGSYPPNLSMMAFRFCARGPRGRVGASTLRSGALSFLSSEGGGAEGPCGTSLGEDSLLEGLQRHGKGIRPTPRAAGGPLGRGHHHV